MKSGNIEDDMTSGIKLSAHLTEFEKIGQGLDSAMDESVQTVRRLTDKAVLRTAYQSGV